METDYKCAICGREQVKTGELKVSFLGQEIKIPQYRLNLLTYMCGKHICEDCMVIYRKIHAMESGVDFICGEVEYFADGRNLPS